jgi:hypothetical protein
VKTRLILLVSFGLNLALTTTLVALRWRSPVATAPMAAEETAPHVVTNELVSASAADSQAAPAAAVFHWRMIESKNVRQYVANLRRIGCPEKILRDLVLAEVDRHFKPKLEFNQLSYQPWQGADRREADRRAWEERRAVAGQEKRALIRELLGYEWSNEVSNLWDTEPTLVAFLGFLADTKAQQVMAVVASQMDKAKCVLQPTGGILIDEDYQQLRDLRNNIRAELGRLLAAGEFDELESRAQLGLVFSQKLHLEGMNLNGFELREIMRASRSYKDILLVEGWLQETRPASEAASKLAEFEKVIAIKLGPARLAEFKRAQDQDFRSTFAFTQKQKLAKETAVKVYEAQRSAEQQATEIRADNSLSIGEKAAALQFLQETTAASLTSALGRAAANYFNGPGKWLDTFTAAPGKKSKPSPGGRR